jgi:hypothetical protein
LESNAKKIEPSKKRQRFAAIILLARFLAPFAAFAAFGRNPQISADE